MNMIKRLLMIALSLLAFTGQANAETYSVQIPSNPIWTNTGIWLNNTSFSISATGSWSWAGNRPGVGFFGPNGDPNESKDDNWVFSANIASLIGYIGNDYTGHDPYSASSGWFNVGSKTYQSNATGELWLGFNDDKLYPVEGPKDNFGSVTAIITTVPEPEEWVMMFLGAGMVGFQVKRKKASC